MAAEHAEPSLAGEKWARSLPPPAIFCPRDLEVEQPKLGKVTQFGNVTIKS